MSFVSGVATKLLLNGQTLQDLGPLKIQCQISSVCPAGPVTTAEKKIDRKTDESLQAKILLLKTPYVLSFVTYVDFPFLQSSI